MLLLVVGPLGVDAGSGEVRAQGGSAVHGRVRDAAGRPVHGASVWLEPRGGRTSTDADGLWTIGGVAPGHHRVLAAAPGFTDAAAAVHVPREGEAARVDLTLHPAVPRLAEIVTLVERAPVPAGARRVLRREELARAGSVAAALERVPGVFVEAYGGAGARHASIRGADPEATLVLWGEERLLAPGGGAVDLASIPPASVDSIEVVTHGASARWGAGAAGGVIRLHPATAGGSALRSAEGWVGAGSLGWREASGRLALPVRGGGVALTGEARAYERNHARSVNGDGSEGGLGLAAALPGWRASAAVHANARGAPGPVNAPSPEARTDGERLLAGVVHDRRAGAWALRAEAAVQRATLAFEDPSRPALGSSSRETSLAFRAAAQRPLGRHGLDGGIEVRRRDARSTELTGRPARWELSAWSGGRWSPGAIPRLVLSPTLRGDVVTLEGGGGDRRDVFVSPALSAAFELAPSLAATAFAGRSFRYPAFESLFFLSGVGVRSNPDLREERSRDLAAELSWRGPAGVTAGVGAFDRVLEGTIVWLPDFRFVWSPRNLPRARVRGFELRAEWRGPAGVELAASWTHAPARFDFPGNANPLPYRPADQARAEIAWRGGSLRAATELRYTGRRHPNVAGTNALGSYALVDLAAAWSRGVGGSELALEVRVDNLLDRSYDVVFGFPAAGRALRAGLRWRS